MAITTTGIDLLDVLQNIGLDRLRDGAKEISAVCPQHLARTGRVDRHPSWSISKTKFTHLCFSCGYKGTLTQLLTDMGHPPGNDLETELKKQSFLRKMAEKSPEEILEPVLPVLNDWMLHNIFLDVPKRLLELRHLRRSAVDAYGVRWDRERKCWVLPIRDQQGALMGAQFRQQGSFFNDPAGMARNAYIFGLSQMKDQDYVTVVESPLDAVRLYGLGIPAVSTLGAWVSDQQARLLARNFTRVYLAFDNDKAGQEANTRLFPQLRKMGVAPVMWYYANTTEKDVGDVVDDEDVIAMWNATLKFGITR